MPEIHSISMLSLPEPPRDCNIFFHHVTVGGGGQVPYPHNPKALKLTKPPERLEIPEDPQSF